MRMGAVHEDEAYHEDFSMLIGRRMFISGNKLVTCDCNCAVTVSSTGAKNLLQGDDNGHVGRPCEVSLDPPCQELFCELLGLCRHSYFGPRTCSRSEKPMSSK